MQKTQIEDPGQLRFHPDLKGPLDKLSLSLDRYQKRDNVRATRLESVLKTSLVQARKAMSKEG